MWWIEWCPPPDPRLLVGLYRVVREHVLHDGGPLSHGVVGHERWGLVGGEKRQELRLVPHDFSYRSRPDSSDIGSVNFLTPGAPDAHKPSGAAKRIDGEGCVGVANLGERGGIDGHRVPTPGWNPSGCTECPCRSAPRRASTAPQPASCARWPLPGSSSERLQLIRPSRAPGRRRSTNSCSWLRLITVRSAVRARMGPLFPRTWPGKSFLGSARLLLGWPAIPGSVGRCLIHWATGPLTLLLRTSSRRL